MGRILSGLLLATLACAKIVPPTGGPTDETSPEIVAYAPDSNGVRVGRDDPLSLSFSEKMNKSSVRDWLLIAPWPGKLECRWDRNAMTCVPLDGWADETAYVVMLAAKAFDKQRNTLEKPFYLSFTTGDSLPTGWITGRVITRSIGAEGLLIILLPWPASGTLQDYLGSGGLDVRGSALRLGETDHEGRFELRSVRWDREYVLVAMWDSNGNRVYDETEDLLSYLDRPVRCGAFRGRPETAADSAGVAGLAESDSAGAEPQPDAPRAGHYEIHLVYPDEPGNVKGVVLDPACLDYVSSKRLQARSDSLERILSGELDATGFAATDDSLATLALTPAEEESIRVALVALEGAIADAAADSARCEATLWVSAFAEGDTIAAAEVRSRGPFDLAELPPGLYRLQAFRDLNGNGQREATEPQGTFPALIELLPGRIVEGADMRLETGEGDGR